MSWIFLEIPPGNLLEICSVKFVDSLHSLLVGSSNLSKMSSPKWRIMCRVRR